MKVVKIIHDGLHAITLPPLTRPAVGPHDDATEELARWGIKLYAYSSIAHMRHVLAGVIILSDSGNVPSANVISRHAFEWTAHACYMHENLTPLMAERQWSQVFDLTLQSDTGNLWVKRHGHKYDDSSFPEDALKPLHISKLIAAYTKYQTERYGKTDVEDTYGFLSENSHPNGACFMWHRDIIGPDVHFVNPPTHSAFGGINRFIIQWLMFTQQLLGLARESLVRDPLIYMLPAIVDSAK